MFNESIISNLSSGGYIADSFSLGAAFAILSWSLWAASIAGRFIWKFIDETDFKILPWVNKSLGISNNDEDFIYEFLMHFLFVPIGGLILVTIVAASLHHPTFSLVVSGLIFLMFVARYGRRTHKALKKHMNDKNAHKEAE